MNVHWFSISLALLSITSCRAEQPEKLARTARCGAHAAGAGELLRVASDTSIWYRSAGDPARPTLLYLHGGPGYNAYNFEQSVGPLLEPQLRMLYLDQRGCGRSRSEAPEASFGLTNAVADIERLRRHLGIERMYLLSHSFGGLLALEYERTHAEHVAGLILVDTTGDIAGALRQQMRALVELSASQFPEQRERLAALAHSDKPASVQVDERYAILPRLRLQRALYFATDAAQAKNEAWDAEFGLQACDSGPVVRKYIADGELDASHPELMRPLRSPAIVFAGRLSHAIGEELILAAAARWGAPVRWFERSGHFVYVEEPEAFAEAVIGFVGR